MYIDTIESNVIRTFHKENNCVVMKINGSNKQRNKLKLKLGFFFLFPFRFDLKCLD